MFSSVIAKVDTGNTPGNNCTEASGFLWRILRGSALPAPRRLYSAYLTVYWQSHKQCLWPVTHNRKSSSYVSMGLWSVTEIHFLPRMHAWNSITLSAWLMEFCSSRIKSPPFAGDVGNICNQIYSLLAEYLPSELPAQHLPLRVYISVVLPG